MRQNWRKVEGEVKSLRFNIPNSIFQIQNYELRITNYEIEFIKLKRKKRKIKGIDKLYILNSELLPQQQNKMSQI